MDRLRVLLKRHSGLVAYAGLVVLIVVLASYVVAQQAGVWVQVLLVVGVALLILYIGIESARVRTSVTGRAARYGANSLLMIVAFVGIMVMVNVLSANHFWRWDVTASKQYSISEQTINILEGLQDQVKVIGFFSTANPYQRESQMELENLLKSYMLYTDKLSYEFIDPDLKPGLAHQHEITSYGTLVFERGDKRQHTTALDFTEGSLTAALLKMSRDEVKSVYFLTGHKERDLEDTGEWGYRTIKQRLEKNNYKVDTINFTINDTVPSDLDVLVLASPQTSLSDQELETVHRYLRDGGKALILSDPSVADPFGDLLTQWGVAFRDDLVLDPASSFPQDISAVVATEYEFPEITSGVEGLITFFPGVRSLDVLGGVTKTITVSPIIQSSEMSWGETGYQDETEFGLDEDVDVQGPLPVAVAVVSSDNDTRLAVFGNSEFVSNSALQNVQGSGNQDLFAGAINWLAEEEELIAISPKPSDQRFLVMSPGSSRLVIFFSLTLLPLGVIVAGVAVWWRRRR